MIFVEKQIHKRKNCPIVWAEVWFFETSPSSSNWSIVLRDWECPGHDVSGMFTVPYYAILDLAPCALPWNAHRGLTISFKDSTQSILWFLVYLLLGKERQQMCFGQAGKMKYFQDIWEGRAGGAHGKSWWCSPFHWGSFHQEMSAWLCRVRNKVRKGGRKCQTLKMGQVLGHSSPMT